MDLWDLTRLLFRRWYIALPLLLASLLTAALVGQSVKPDYRATGNVVLIPPPGPANPTEGPKPGEAKRPRNPWADLGLMALGNATILKVVDQNTLKRLDEAGLTESITVQMNERAPIFYVEAVGSTEAQATATVKEVIALLAAEIAEQQKSFGVLPQDTITTLTLTDGADVEPVTSKAKRVLIVIVGLGLLVSASGTIGLDVLIRRRRHKGPTPASDTDGQPGSETATSRATASADPSDWAGVQPSTAAPDRADPTTRLLLPRPLAGADRGREQTGARRVGAESTAAGPVEGGQQRIAQSRVASPSAEETVILPLLGSQRLRPEDRNGGR